MILGPVSLVDCFVFCLFLAPALLAQVGIIDTILVACQALPFLLLKLPYELIRERYFVPVPKQSLFVQQATLFEDLVIRCVRFAFTYIPPEIGRVFFSKWVALPFKAFREVRHGKISPGYVWKSYGRGPGVRGVWLRKRDDAAHDIIVYYVHGGGFTMGSPYFYIEFLVAWLSLLHDAGFRNPAVFALEYTLVPKAIYPTQHNEVLAGYRMVLNEARRSPNAQVVVAGDSAGANLVLSLLLALGTETSALRMPALCVLISPWATLVSPEHRNTRSDYIDADRLHQFGLSYAGGRNLDMPLVSPGSCKDVAWWKVASPDHGFFVHYGGDEVLAADADAMVELWRTAGVEVGTHREPAGIHAWVVASLFLSSTRAKRVEGLMACQTER